MNININLIAQSDTKSKRLHLFLGFFALAFIIIVLAMPTFGLQSYYFLLIFIIPVAIESIYFGASGKRLFMNKYPCLKIDDKRLETCSGGILANTKIIYWRDVRQVKIKLFDIEIESSDGKASNISLANLTDENLKIVKGYVENLKLQYNF